MGRTTRLPVFKTKNEEGQKIRDDAVQLTF